MEIDKKAQTQINVKLLLSEKMVLLKIAKSKGVGGVTGLLKLIASAKEVKIKS